MSGSSQMDYLDRLRQLLRAHAPEYHPWSPNADSRFLDGRISIWMSALQEDAKAHVAGPIRSHASPASVLVATVAPHPGIERSIRRAAPRDAACFLDPDVEGSFEYWITFSRSLIEDLYFIFAAVSLGPSQFFRQQGSGPSYLDVRDPGFLVSSEADESLQLTSVAIEFIYFHELTHAIRAHIPYLQARGVLDRACLCEIGAHATENPSLPIVHQAVELDADLTALGIQLHFASAGQRASSIVGTDDPANYCKRLGFALGVVFRVFELWRRDLRGVPFNPEKATHPHPDVREILADAWLAQRDREPGSIHQGLCEAVRSARDAGQAALQALGPNFLPGMKYVQTRPRDDVAREIERVREALYNTVRPDLSTFVARRQTR